MKDSQTKLVDEIMNALLRSNVYQPNSGAAANLRDSLERCSLTTVKRLHLIVKGQLQ